MNPQRKTTRNIWIFAVVFAALSWVWTPAMAAGTMVIFLGVMAMINILLPDRNQPKKG